MGKRRYLAALETVLQLISEDKLQAIAQTMVDMDVACRKKLGEQLLSYDLQQWALVMPGGNLPLLCCCAYRRVYSDVSPMSVMASGCYHILLALCPVAVCLLLLFPEETRTKVKELLDTAASKGVAGATLMAAAVKTMTSAVEQEDMPKEDKLRVSGCKPCV
jgi:hypothetical protein